MSLKLFLIVFLGIVALSNADVYLHSPRGSNNRLDEANRDRQNGNRMFDSQNNNRGGYNVGSVYYYEGSKAYLEWSVQHSCGNANNHCEIVLQYMCDDKIRDGTERNTIPTDPNQCIGMDCDTDVRYGRHESYDWYQECLDTERNYGLFTASENLQGNSARYTRQNEAGTRRGYECPEERDYYPYWRPSPWRDIAIFTNEPERCEMYKQESQNVQGKYYCKTPGNYTATMKANNQRGFLPITKEACEEIYEYDPKLGQTVQGQWTQQPAWGMDAPDCRQNQFSRDNHHGNIEGGFFMGYNWTIPSDVISENCVFRMRYNISTYDWDHWEDNYSTQSNAAINASINSQVSNPNSNEDPSYVPIWEKFNIPWEDVEDSFDTSLNNNADGLRNSREYVHVDNPDVNIFGSLITGASDGYLKLQVNSASNQFGRTFEDRSHRFAIRKRPAELEGVTIHNIQVRGKRGNIVQVYPGVEYDFVPNRLHVGLGEYVHFQWTGSNTNPNNNAGQGQAGSDRSNIVVQWGVNDADKIIGADYGYGPNVYYEDGQVDDPSRPTYGQWGTSFPANIQETEFLGLSKEDMETLATLSSNQMGGELSELDDAGTYFDLGPKKVTMSGIYHYLSTRNNNFSNRSQKGKIVVSTEVADTGVVGWEGGKVSSGEAAVIFEQGATTEAVAITIVRQPPTSSQSDDGVASDYVYLYPLDIPTGDGDGDMKLKIPYDDSWTPSGHSVYWEPEGIETSNPIDITDKASMNDGVATVSISDGGVYWVETSPIDVFLAILIPVAALFLAAAAFVFYKYNQNKDSDYQNH